ncbi:MAG: hypothetical protein IPH11_08150 [Ignavibacteriales bacterium]|nr:hypothetical protein [Ignavibacteriales bacterium]
MIGYILNKNYITKIFFFSLLFFLAVKVTAQDNGTILPEGLGLSNQLEYSYDIEKKQEILENWLNVDYNRGIFSAGFRFDLFQPNDPNPSISRGKEKFAGIDYKYITAEIGEAKEGLDITVGNFYQLFGRGLIVKSYEDRNIRVDNNLLGVSVQGSYENIILSVFSGSMENALAERKDILHAIDIDFRRFRQLRIGGTFASNQPENDAAATRLASLRIQQSLGDADIYAEYGIKQNNDISKNIFNDEENIIGKAFYGNLNFYHENLSFSGEYKYYDNFLFQSDDGTIVYNTPPALKKEYAYTLINRHPSALNQNNEKGFLFEVNYDYDDDTYFNTAYSETRTIGSSSLFQRQNSNNSESGLQFREGYFQANHNLNENFYFAAAFGYREEKDTDTKNFTPILESRYYFNEINTLKLIIEHQSTTNNITSEQYYTDLLSLEYLRSPRFSLALVTEIETREPQSGNVVRRLWGYLQAGYKLGEHTDLTILFGSRQAGNICIGGVCRFEPEFRGIEFKMLTRL